MNILSFKSKRKYKIVKLLRIVNKELSQGFPLKRSFNICCDFFLKVKDEYPSFYTINYGKKSWSTKKGFEKAIANKKDSDIVYLSSIFNSNKSQSYFLITNSLMNNTNPPKISSIDIELAIEAELVKDNDIKKLLNDLYDVFSFDYGYIIELDDRYDFHTEAKINKGLLGSRTNNLDLDRQWIFHSVGVNEGYIKKLYKYNLLNHSQINQPIIKSLIERNIGKVEELNNGLKIWSLSDADFRVANEELNDSKYVIINQNNINLFMNSPEATKFNNLMKLN